MRVCYSADDIGRDRPAGADRPLPRERDRDRRRRGLRRHRHVHRRGHAARRGGGRALRRLGVRAAGAVAHRRGGRRDPRGRAHARAGARRRRAAERPARARRRRRSSCSRRTRAHRAPFRSRRKATGVNLVQAACRVVAGARLSELDLPAGAAAWDMSSVKAAVLPFARFPGADPVLGPEMRATGEVMATAADLPTAFAKAERAAGRPLPASGTAFLSVRDADKPAVVPVAASLARARVPAAGDVGHRRHARSGGARRGARAQGDGGGERCRRSST